MKPLPDLKREASALKRHMKASELLSELRRLPLFWDGAKWIDTGAGPKGQSALQPLVGRQLPEDEA